MLMLNPWGNIYNPLGLHLKLMGITFETHWDYIWNSLGLHLKPIGITFETIGITFETIGITFETHLDYIWNPFGLHLNPHTCPCETFCVHMWKNIKNVISLPSHKILPTSLKQNIHTNKSLFKCRYDVDISVAFQLIICNLTLLSGVILSCWCWSLLWLENTFHHVDG